LHKLAGSSFKERWAVCKESRLSYYSHYTSKKPRGEFYLTDCEFNRETINKRPYILNILHTPTKKRYYLSFLTEDSLNDWKVVMIGSGAVDKDTLLTEKDAKEREKKLEEIKAAKEARKRENDYVREKMRRRSTLRLINKNMSVEEINTCFCEMVVTRTEMKEGQLVFKIEVTFDDQKWVIFRKYEKVLKLYNSLEKLKFVKGMCPPKKAPSCMTPDQFSQLQIAKLQSMLNTLSQFRSCLMGSSSAKQGYLTFISPVSWDDVKPNDFVMPFMIEF